MLERYRHPVAFYVLATLLPWGFWLAAGRLSWAEPPAAAWVVSTLGGLGLLAPVATAAALVWRDAATRRDILSRLVSLRRVGLSHGLIACLLMPASILAATAVSLPFGYDAGQFAIASGYSFSSGVFPVWFLLVAAPVIEELGWHAYGTDTLRARFSLLATSLIFSAYWGIWHIPLAGIKDYYQAKLMTDGAIHAANFLVSIFPFVIVMNWLYYKTGRSILITCVFHITAGYFNELFATHPDTKVIQTGLLALVAAFLILREPQFFLRRESRDFSAHRPSPASLARG